MVQIQRKAELIRAGVAPLHRDLILNAIEYTINAMCPDVLLKNKIKFDGSSVQVENVKFPLKGKIYVIGTGKASGKMAETLESVLPIEKGYVSVPEGTAKNYSCKKIQLIEAGHPFPNEGSLLAANKMVALSSEVTKNDIVFSVISGGGSSLLSMPEEGLILKDKIQIEKRVMKSGADIGELNAVRKSLSQVKGGKLAMHFKHARLINLILSDVLGNPLSVIASGPTILDRYTYAEAKTVLEKYDLWDPQQSYCREIERNIMRGVLPLNMEKVQPQISTFIIGDNDLAVKTVVEYLESKNVKIAEYRKITGSAKDVGKKFAILLNKGVSFVAGAETTVRVNSNGVGGRNLEVALDAAMHLGKGTLASVGTDGKDGISSAAGAIVDYETKLKAKKAGLNMAQYLNYNDSYTFFDKLGDGLVITGPTGTNVCDIIIGIA